MQDISLEASLSNLVVRVFRQVNRVHNRALKPHGLSAEQAHILTMLWFGGAMRVGQLQSRLAVSSGTIAGGVERMVKAQLLRKARAPEDGRAFVLAPTETAETRRAAVEKTLRETEDEVFGVLSADERQTLLELLGRVSAALAERDDG